MKSLSQSAEVAVARALFRLPRGLQQRFDGLQEVACGAVIASLMGQNVGLRVGVNDRIAVLVLGLSTAGFAPTASTPTAAAPVAAFVDPAATPQVKVDTVYLAVPKKAPTVIVHKTVPAAGGEHETQSEGAGD